MNRFIEILLSSSATVSTILICAIAGYLLRRFELVPKKFSVVLSKMVFYAFLPCMLFSKTASSITPERINDLWIFPVSFLLFMGTGMILGCVLVKIIKPKPEFIRPIIASTSFSNCGFLPISLMMTACNVFPALSDNIMAPKDSITYISAYLLTATSFLWTLGYAIISGRSHRDFIWRNLITPPIIGLLLGTTIGLIPAVSQYLILGHGFLYPIFGATEILSQGTVPCVLLLLGAGLADSPKQDRICIKSVSSVICVKLIIIPVIGLFYIYYLRRWGILTGGLLPALVLAVEAAMPPANNLIVMASLSESKASSGLAHIMFWSYLTSILTITLVIAAAIYLFSQPVGG